MKRIALIGHRGVGKTSLLARIERYDREAGQKIRTYDLDREIEKRTGRSVSEIFQGEGEAVFRDYEQQVFTALSIAERPSTEDVNGNSDADVVAIALGAGFDVTKIPRDWHVIWVRRVTDAAGRIFTDRPRLDRTLTAIEEYKHRAQRREPHYAARADAVLFLDEGIEDADDPAERAYFTDKLNLEGATLTLKPESFARDVSAFLTERLNWNLKWFELRDDLLTHSQLVEAIAKIPPGRILLSFRDKSRIEKTKSLIAKENATDWALELGPPQIDPTFVSKHEGQLDDLKHASAKLKAALPTSSFDDLIRGHRWQQQDPNNRVFLPMSIDGRWAWYRDHRRDYELNFVKENEGTATDQPTLLQWQRKPTIETFAAVLGDPVKHSRTPMEHRSFFAPRAVYAIQIQENEFENSIQFLNELGLTHAAVTSPLKEKAQQLAGAIEPINTLAFVPEVLATNTDVIGLREAVKQIPTTTSQVVWGGGGTLSVLRRVFPDAQFVSARTKFIRDTNRRANPPELVIWAATLKHGEQDPPDDWKPRFVFDLNYSEASAARDYAVKIGAIYISGLAMFKAQAQAQREFWENV